MVEQGRAERAVEAVAGRRPDQIGVLASGRSSTAFIAEVDADRWVVRVPIEGSGRPVSYFAEAAIGRLLVSGGHPVAEWSVLDVDGIRCSVARRLSGTPVDYDGAWSAEFAQQFARLLHTLHDAPADGFGPLLDDSERLHGISPDRIEGIVDRWRHAPMWPFDGSTLDEHPLAEQAPDLVAKIVELSDRIFDAEHGAIGVTHSDLHREHVLVDGDGTLAAVLDFGDAFIGAVAWDFALIAWYYGQRNAQLVADHYPGGNDALERGLVLAVAVGVYKLAKNPADRIVIDRLTRCLRSMPTR